MIIQLLFELDQQQSSIELNALLIDLIRIADSESDAVSLERLNMMKVLAKE
ncbi:MAG: hypothetical protein R2813_06695 [Flavobacteriales bacterium]